MVKETFLVWKFEAFREYLSYEVLRNAAQVLSLYEGEEFNIRNPKIIDMQNLLATRTNKSTWMPNRSGEQYLNVNAEGDVYRNKGRLFTSMLILFPKDLSDNKVKLTDFGKKLAGGYLPKQDFYKFIICNYKYPHPAYMDDYEKWVEKGIILLPFILILQVLMKLEALGQNYLTTDEVAFFLYRNPDHNHIDDYVKLIVSSREKNEKIKVESSDKVTRKINDIFGFLLMSGYLTQSKKGKFSINLSKKVEIQSCIENSLEKYLEENINGNHC